MAHDSYQNGAPGLIPDDQEKLHPWWHNSSAGGFGKGTGKGAGKDTKDLDGTDDAVDESEIRFCAACCCTNTGFITKDCCGCSGDGQCCCLRQRFCCVAGADKICCEAPKGDMCQLGIGFCGCGCTNCMGSKETGKSCSCIKNQSQLCCLVHSCALPTTNDIPCMFGLLGMSCYPKFGCCEKLKHVAKSTKKESHE